MKKRLYLDFDGVVNVSRAPKSQPWEHDTGWSTHKRERLHADGERWTIHYAPELVEELNALSQAGVEIIWCSTWEQHTAEFHKLGFNRFSWLPLTKFSYMRHSSDDPYCMDIDVEQKDALKSFENSFWDKKTSSVLVHLKQSPAHALWVDDELSSDDIIAAFHANIKALPSYEYIGLTPDMLQFVYTYLKV